MDEPILVATEVHQGLIIKIEKERRNTIKAWTKSRYIQVSLGSKEQNWSIHLIGAAILSSHELFDFLG
jgi:hypothetical protein